MSKSAPIVSILTPVYRPDLDHFVECVESVLSQESADWELVLVDDNSGESAVEDLLRRFDRHPSVRVVFRGTNGGIVAASNDALRAASGDLVAFLDHDDLLAPSAVADVVAARRAHPDAETFYSDRGHISESGERVRPDLRKPRWSPERLRGGMYIAHLTVLDRAAAIDVGGFRQEFEGSQDHDLVLRVTERGQPVIHIPEILYHWRMSERSTAADPDAKPYARLAGAAAVQEHCDRMGIAATVKQTETPGWYLLDRESPAGAVASIIIPTMGSHATIDGEDRCMVVEAVRSVVAAGSTVPFEIVVVYDDRGDNDLEYLEALRDVAGELVTFVRFTEPFNFSAKVNAGALRAKGNILVLLNDDTEVISTEWLDHLCSIAFEADVGAVGAKLLFENGLVQHAGIGGHSPGTIVNLDCGQPNDGGYFGTLIADHEVLGVTGACLAVRAKVYQEVGGFSEEFAGSFNDVDFCFKTLMFGYRNVVATSVSLFHYESLTRDPSVSFREHNLLLGRWHNMLASDPYSRFQSPSR